MTADREDGEQPDLDAYCRAIEAHLCRKNDGHLIRVSGPAFEMVRGWAEQGIPLGVATAGIDRTFERYYAKGPRRRPVHVSFCEDDVLDAFDGWRRALGVSAAPGAAALEGGDAAVRPARQETLPAHLERVLNRLTVVRATAAHDRELDDALDARGARDRRGPRRGAPGARRRESGDRRGAGRASTTGSCSSPGRGSRRIAKPNCGARPRRSSAPSASGCRPRPSRRPRRPPFPVSCARLPGCR